MKQFKARALTFIIILCLMTVNTLGCDRSKIDSSPGNTSTVLISPSPRPTNGIAPYKTVYDNDNQRFTNFHMYYYGTDPYSYEYILDNYLPNLTTNCMDMWVCWYAVEREKGKYDFSGYDYIINKLASNGIKVSVRINTMDIPQWIMNSRDSEGRCKYTQWDYDQKDFVNGSSTGGSRAGVLSYANPEARKFALDYTTALVKHFTEKFKDWPGGNPIHLYSPCFSNSGEMEYGGYSCDYSPAAITSFRNWLEIRYADITLLNERWGMIYGSFDNVEAPAIGNIESVAEMDWLEYRAYEQGNMIKLQSEAIKAIDPDADYAMVFGSVYDAIIKTRGTLFADYWADYVDWIGVADDFSYNHRYSMSVARGISKGGGLYNEAFRQTQGQSITSTDKRIREAWDKMTEESFDEGANQMNYAAFDIRDTGDKGLIYYNSGPDYIKNAQKVTRPTPKRAIYMSTWSITRDTGGVTYEGEVKFNELRKNGYIDVIRDGTFENDVDYLVNTYTDIYFISNLYISDSARAALLEAQKRGVRLHDVNCKMDKYGNARLSFDKINTDTTAPKVKAAAGKGSIVGISSDVGSGINRIEVTFKDGKIVAKGTDTWSVSTDGKSGKATVVAYDNNGNASEKVVVSIQ